MKQLISIYKIKKIVNKILSQFNLQLVNRTWYKKLIPEHGKFDDEGFSAKINKKHFIDYFAFLHLSKSQFRQDLFVLSELGFKKKGFFLEFGATNGIDLSNTHLLETHFGWNGILAEPAISWHPELLSNREAKIDKNCVWKLTGEKILFNEVADKELSSIDVFSNSDGRNRNKKNSSVKYEVETISLYDLLKKHNAPFKIDYLSIDTEGSEFEILNAFDFDTFDIKVITCEHNYTQMRQKIFKLLTDKGYVRKYSQFSLCDDWYVRQ